MTENKEQVHDQHAAESSAAEGDTVPSSEESQERVAASSPELSADARQDDQNRAEIVHASAAGNSAADERENPVGNEAGSTEEGPDLADDLLPGESDESDDFFDDSYVDEDEDLNENAAPIESLVEDTKSSIDDSDLDWYILKVQVNRETSICDSLKRRVARAGLDHYFSDILVPTEDVREFTKTGKQRIVKRKLYPGYVVVRMAINDESWFLVRETPGIGDFTGASGKPIPLTSKEIEQILKTTRPGDKDKSEEPVKIGIKYKVGDRVRVKEGNFQNYEGEVSNIDERNGRVTIIINIFNRPNPVELDHWQVEEFS
ncbi:MAG TPA: transcription termination/antitermination protein NusG [Pirellulaceae bacterium]|nr:transcription termination/antitermination protein NusG [Pirellulaceae bacterium]HMO92485.1 transcription termination/antitermination protein NusG [Pirellulaceae bacterium]HMP67845.1 transcription termination/antitermination protein NusG [Pirellulaceae bacterium]